MSLKSALLTHEIRQANHRNSEILHFNIHAFSRLEINITLFLSYVNQVIRKASLQNHAVRATEIITEHLPNCLLLPITLSINIDMAEGWLKAEAHSSTYEN
jgi:hypothetical protein